MKGRGDPGLWADLLWAFRMFKARRWRQAALFSQRAAFDDHLRPIRAQTLTGARHMIAYPDAIYCARAEDFRRAYQKAKPQW